MTVNMTLLGWMHRQQERKERLQASGLSSPGPKTACRVARPKAAVEDDEALLPAVGANSSQAPETKVRADDCAPPYTAVRQDDRYSPLREVGPETRVRQDD